jgi:hypothetical protein
VGLVNVTACLVTRGDVDLSLIVNSIAEAGISEIVVWDNSVREDRMVYGRYAAIAEASHDLIYVQDDDVLHHPHGIQEMLKAYNDQAKWKWLFPDPKPSPMVPHDDFVLCNMPRNFRHAFYQEHALVGFGAVFHRDAPERVFKNWGALLCKAGMADGDFSSFFHRTCDIVFTALTPRVLVDVLYQDMDWASAPNRMWVQPTHREERQQMLDMVLKVRDAA